MSRRLPTVARPERLLSVADQDLPGTETMQIACDPEVKRSHVQTECHVRGHHRLKLRYDAKGMDRSAAFGSTYPEAFFPLTCDVDQEPRHLEVWPRVFHKRCERGDSRAHVANQLYTGTIAVVDVRSFWIDVDDRSRISPVPNRRPVLDRIVANRDHQIRSS